VAIPLPHYYSLSKKETRALQKLVTTVEMRVFRSSCRDKTRTSTNSITAAVLLLFPTVTTALWNCQALSHNLRPLEGTHEIKIKKETPPTTTDYRYMLNICDQLEKPKEDHPENQCLLGTQGTIDR
jgi:hypothetical protein